MIDQEKKEFKVPMKLAKDIFKLVDSIAENKKVTFGAIKTQFLVF